MLFLIWLFKIKFLILCDLYWVICINNTNNNNKICLVDTVSISVFFDAFLISDQNVSRPILCCFT